MSGVDGRPAGVNSPAGTPVTNSRGTGGEAPATDYKDRVANVFLGSISGGNGQPKSSEIVGPAEDFPDEQDLPTSNHCDPFNLEKLQPPCPTYALVGECVDCGAKYAKTLYCGREWCENCREETQNRRFSRWLPKAQRMSSMGYFDIEWPTASRYKLRSRQALIEAGNTVKAVLSGDWEVEMWRASGTVLSKEKLGLTKEWWFPRGLRRWHFFNSPSPVFNPHLNVLVDGRYLIPKQLKIIKGWLRIALREPSLIVNYHYTTRPAQMQHHVRYVVRSTFLDASWDLALACEVHGFKNALSWGTWDGEAVWFSFCCNQAQAICDLENSFCPECGGQIDWERLIGIGVLNRAISKGRAWPIEANGARAGPDDSPSGYYRLANDFGEPKPLSQEILRRLYGDDILTVGELLAELNDF